MRRRWFWLSIPHIAAWGKLQIDSALGAAGTNVATVGLDKLGQVGVLYHGLEVLGGGAILGGLVLGAIGAFVIDKQIRRGVGLRGGGRGSHLLRLHARRGGGFCGQPHGRRRLCTGSGVAVRFEPRARHGAGSGSCARCDPCGVAVASLLRLEYHGRARLSGLCR